MLTFIQPRSRGHAAARGVLAAVLGGVLMLWPGITIGTVVVLLAIYAFADEIASGAGAFASGRTAGDRVLLGLRALVETGAAVAAIAYPAPTAEVMTVILGLYAVAVGVTELTGSGLLARVGAGGTGWVVVGGILSIVAGGLLIGWPGVGAVTLAILFGAYLLAYGATLLVSAVATGRREPVAAGA